ncbi:MAG: hypothetical protein OEZ57_09495, partial [Nitrospirota bacterium]|nr:hypothetical protein [Nitrospirota bacterium]
NYVIINEKPNLPNTSQILTQSFGTSLVTTVLNQGVPTKINPVILVKKDQDEKERQQKAIAQREEQKKQEMAKLNGLKEKMTTLRETGGTVSLRNLLGGS